MGWLAWQRGRNKMHIIIALALFIFTTPTSLAGGLDEAMKQSTSGMKAQGSRMKVIAQNIANAESTGKTPGAEPYRRKQIFFKNKYDKKLGYNVVQVVDIKNDKKTPLGKRFDPSHPAANEDGYVLLPNVESSMEVVDMKEAERSYQANLGAVEITKRMVNATIDLLR